MSAITDPRTTASAFPGLPDTNVPFVKMSGSGNDFVVIDNRSCHVPNQVVARFAVRAGIAPGECRFETEVGLVHAIVSASVVDPVVRIEIVVGGESHVVSSVQVGVPHVVLIVPDADGFGDTTTFVAFGRAVRNHPAFAPDGTNVNVIHRIDAHTLRTRTYERGVESETLACGTGAIASAIVGVARGLVEHPVTMMASSGRPLRVDFALEGDRVMGVHRGGEARFIATGVLDPEGWQ